MTLFGLDTPWSLFESRNTEMRAAAEKKFVASMDQWLEEPLADCLAVARDGSLCLESKSPVDIEDALGLYHGNIFQNAPTFPFAESEAQAGALGRGNGMGKRLPLRLERAPRRRGQWNSRPQRGDEGAGVGEGKVGEALTGTARPPSRKLSSGAGWNARASGLPCAYPASAPR